MVKRMLFVFLLQGSFAVYGLAQCVKGDCFNGEGSYKAKNGAIYQGQFRMGKFNGKGTIWFASNDVFTGSFSNGKKEGSGRYRFASGHEYVGDFVADKRQGKGKMTYANGDIYKGQWQHDYPHGSGEYLFADGSAFRGNFKMGNFDGEGRFSESDGNAYQGVWKDNVLVSKTQNTVNQPSIRPAGSGQVVNRDKKLKDCTNQHCHDEEGRFNYRDGSYYLGYFSAGKPQGEGVCNYASGDVYKGGWKSHGPHGFGTMIKADGKVYSGIWEYGSLKQRSYETEALAKLSNEGNREKEYFNDEIDIYAVIVGVATYNHMTSLRYTDDDAYHLYAFLKSPEGGAIPDDQISILIDDAASRKNILSEISKTFSKADANDVIMLYMSGHGLEGSFVPFDFDGTNNLLAYDDMLNLIEASRAKHKIYITDACHSGSMYASKSPYQMALTDFYSKFSASTGGTAIITSSKKDEVSLEYSGMRHGVFSHYLIQGLKGDANKNNDQIISVEELFNYIYLNVRHHTNNTQTPSIYGDYDREMPVGVMR
ncbi:MAG: caspase family protein [Saprospiraceae bacterium]|nr:caspase family protein [Saprospiraceae bacterium]